jgi:superfamily II DNA or RNA helicase
VHTWIIDEAHHVRADNKWGKGVSIFPNARGVGFTATPCRGDKRGLGKHVGGLFDHMVIGPTMRELIIDGYLSDYRVFAPPSDLNLNGVNITGSGDYSPAPLANAIQESKIHGDAIEHFKRICPDKQGITFCANVASAENMSVRYNHAGIQAAIVSAKTPDRDRANIIRDFREGRIQQLVNCAIFEEGFDVPGVEVVTMLNPTASYPRYSQAFGRALRVLEGKGHAIILDHVGNVHRHGLPDMKNDWTLDGGTTTVSRLSEVQICCNCASAYESFRSICPRCNKRQPVREQATIEEVCGELCEIVKDDIDRIYADIRKMDLPRDKYAESLRLKHGMPDIGRFAALKRHRKNQEAQQELRELMESWCVEENTWWHCESTVERRFFLKFGVDLLTARTLKFADAMKLIERIQNDRSGSTEQDKIRSE